MFPVLPPPDAEKSTVDPPEVMTFRPGSSECSVRVTSLPEATVSLETVMYEVVSEIGPTFTVTVGSVEVMGCPPIVALIVVALPAVTPRNVAV